ncbi:P-type Ca(2+) transporter [Salvia divinorum]|uniref:P-type Ca(2+) transporter n=1 Tax=Salvia divinorum TaxID=28513 RepID=A0ABD1I7K6_SALDI
MYYLKKKFMSGLLLLLDLCGGSSTLIMAKLRYTELVNFDTFSMTVLVVVEMFNALNNLSENQPLLVIPP